MEETVPLASNIPGGAGSNSSRVQHRPTAAAAAAAAAASNASNDNNRTSSSPSSPSSRQRTGTTTQSQSQPSSSSSILTSISSPTFLISKLIIIISILLKIILYPIRKLSYSLFPIREYDGLSKDGVSDKAAQAFVNMFLMEFVTPRYGHMSQNGIIHSTRTHNIVDSDEQQQQQQHEHHERNNDRELLTTCPFTTKGYMNTIEQITLQHIQHEQSISNLSPSSSFIPTESPPPLLLIYLHSPFHSSTESFCASKLCSNRILKYLNSTSGMCCQNGKEEEHNTIHSSQHHQNQQLVCWGGSIHTADGKNVQSMMNVTAFPFLALVRVRPQSSNSGSGSSSSSSNSSTRSSNHNSQQQQQQQSPTRANLEIYLRLEGHKLSTISSNTLYTYISHSLHEYNTLQNEEISRLITRQEEIHLRNEQDREYRQALEEAQRLERLKEEEENRKIEEERARVEEESRIKKEKEDKLNEAKRILYLYGDDEPSANDTGEKCVRIRLMLPSGKKVERRFRGRDTIDTVKSFLILHFEEMGDKGGKIENFQLSSNYPKKALVDGSATLESEGLYPQAVIMVQDLDA